jgi:lysophospholipase L1-like esterase
VQLNPPRRKTQNRQRFHEAISWVLVSGLLTACATSAPPKAPNVTANPAHSFDPSTIHVVGRVKQHPDGIEYSWPGIYFEGRFSGTAIGLKFDDSVSHFNIEIDGQHRQVLAPPGQATVWVEGLGAGEHQITVYKRNETAFASGRFLGFELKPGDRLLPAPKPRQRQMVFMGDSLTVGYGNASGKRECTDAELAATTNNARSFGALTAQHFDADHHINAYSGLGLVRNFGDAFPGTDHRTYAHRTLLHDSSSVWVKPETWNPSVVVLTLGGPDFATLEASKPWSAETLAPAFKTAYLDLLNTLREQYGGQALFILGVPETGTGHLMREVREVMARHQQAGYSRIDHFSIAMSDLDTQGCHWHASLRDHALIAKALTEVIARWQPQRVGE